MTFKLGDVSPEMMEAGMWALAGHVSPSEMSHDKQEAMLRQVYHAMRWSEGGAVALANIELRTEVERLRAQIIKVTDPVYLEEKLRQIGITDAMADVALQEMGR